MANSLFEVRKPISDIISVPPKVTSVYSLVQHVWDGDNEDEHRQSKKTSRLRLETLQEFYIEPVRSYLDRFLEMIAVGEGQGFWLQAEFGVGKSHMLAVEAILAMGGTEVWELVRTKEDEVPYLGPGRRLDSLWADKVSRKRIFPIIFSLEGRGGTEDNKLEDFILLEAQEVYELRTNRPLPVTSDEHLAEWYIQEGHEDYERSLKRFLSNRRLMERLPNVPSYNVLMDYLRSSEDRRDAATVLWAFLRHRRVKIQLPTERGEKLQTAFDTILGSGYDGILIIIDEMSEYLSRTRFPSDDEDCLLTLSSTLAKAQGKPIWTVVAAQTRYTNPAKIIGPDRMREELLEHKPERFRDIVVRRTRSYQVRDGVSSDTDTVPYYQSYRALIPWVKEALEDDFRATFPFPPEAIDVIRIISRQLTGTRSTIGFLHAALKKAVDEKIDELVPLWRVFDELISYEESPSRSSSGVISLKSKFSAEVDALEAAQTILNQVEEGLLGKKAGKRRALHILNTLFLYRLAGYNGLKPEQILNAVCDLRRGSDETADLQVEYYTSILEEMRLRLRQYIRDRDGLYEFVPRESSELDELVDSALETLQRDRYAFWELFGELLAFNQAGLTSPVSDYSGSGLIKRKIVWHGQERSGRVGMRDMVGKGARAETPDTYYQEDDFVVVLSRRPAGDKEIESFLQTEEEHPDPRVVAWAMDEPSEDERRILASVMAHLKVAKENKGSRHEKEALDAFRQQAPRAFDLVKTLLGRGRAQTYRKTISIDLVGGIDTAIERMAGEALDECYLSAEIDTGKRTFGSQEAVKLINGLVKLGQAVPADDKLYSAVENFAVPLGIVKPVAPDMLNPSDSLFYLRIRAFVEEKGSISLPIETMYRQFTGWSRTAPAGESYGLTRRMVDVYLLCLVQQGIIRIQQKKGPWIDRTTIGAIDFRPDVLRGMERLELPKPLKDWAYLSGYLEVMLDMQPGTLGTKYEMVKAKEALQRVRTLWQPEDKIAGLDNRIRKLFISLDQPVPYDDLLLYWLEFFADPSLPAENEDDDVIANFIFGRILGVAEVGSGEELSSEHLSQFRARWSELKVLLENFGDQEAIVQAAGDYAKAEVPKGAQFDVLRTIQSKLPELVNQASKLVTDPDMVKRRLVPVLDEMRQEYIPLYVGAMTFIQQESRKLFNAVESAQRSPEAVVLRELAANVTEANTLHQEFLAQLNSAEKVGLRREYTDQQIKNTLQLTTCVENDENVPITLKDMLAWLPEITAEQRTVQSSSATCLARLAAFFNSSGVRYKLKEHSGILCIATLNEQEDEATIISHLLTLGTVDRRELGKHLSAILSGAVQQTVQLAEFRPSREYIWTDDDLEAVAGDFREYLKTHKPADGVLRLQ